MTLTKFSAELRQALLGSLIHGCRSPDMLAQRLRGVLPDLLPLLDYYAHNDEPLPKTVVLAGTETLLTEDEKQFALKLANRVKCSPLVAVKICKCWQTTSIDRLIDVFYKERLATIKLLSLMIYSDVVPQDIRDRVKSERKQVVERTLRQLAAAVDNLCSPMAHDKHTLRERLLEECVELTILMVHFRSTIRETSHDTMIVDTYLHLFDRLRTTMNTKMNFGILWLFICMLFNCVITETSEDRLMGMIEKIPRFDGTSLIYLHLASTTSRLSRTDLSSRCAQIAFHSGVVNLSKSFFDWINFRSFSRARREMVQSFLAETMLQFADSFDLNALFTVRDLYDALFTVCSGNSDLIDSLWGRYKDTLHAVLLFTQERACLDPELYFKSLYSIVTIDQVEYLQRHVRLPILCQDGKQVDPSSVDQMDGVGVIARYALVISPDIYGNSLLVPAGATGTVLWGREDALVQWNLDGNASDIALAVLKHLLLTPDVQLRVQPRQLTISVYAVHALRNLVDCDFSPKEEEVITIASLVARIFRGFGDPNSPWNGSLLSACFEYLAALALIWPTHVWSYLTMAGLAAFSAKVPSCQTAFMKHGKSEIPDYYFTCSYLKLLSNLWHIAHQDIVSLQLGGEQLPPDAVAILQAMTTSVFGYVSGGVNSWRFRASVDRANLLLATADLLAFVFCEFVPLLATRSNKPSVKTGPLGSLGEVQLSFLEDMLSANSHQSYRSIVSMLGSASDFISTLDTAENESMLLASKLSYPFVKRVFAHAIDAFSPLQIEPAGLDLLLAPLLDQLILPFAPLLSTNAAQVLAELLTLLPSLTEERVVGAKMFGELMLDRLPVDFYSPSAALYSMCTRIVKAPLPFTITRRFDKTHLLQYLSKQLGAASASTQFIGSLIGFIEAVLESFDNRMNLDSHTCSNIIEACIKYHSHVATADFNQRIVTARFLRVGVVCLTHCRDDSVFNLVIRLFKSMILSCSHMEVFRSSAFDSSHDEMIDAMRQDPLFDLDCFRQINWCSGIDPVLNYGTGFAYAQKPLAPIGPRVVDTVGSINESHLQRYSSEELWGSFSTLFNLLCVIETRRVIAALGETFCSEFIDSFFSFVAEQSTSKIWLNSSICVALDLIIGQLTPSSIILREQSLRESVTTLMTHLSQKTATFDSSNFAAMLTGLISRFESLDTDLCNLMLEFVCDVTRAFSRETDANKILPLSNALVRLVDCLSLKKVPIDTGILDRYQFAEKIEYFASLNPIVLAILMRNEEITGYLLEQDLFYRIVHDNLIYETVSSDTSSQHLRAFADILSRLITQYPQERVVHVVLSALDRLEPQLKSVLSKNSPSSKDLFHDCCRLLYSVSVHYSIWKWHRLSSAQMIIDWCLNAIIKLVKQLELRKAEKMTWSATANSLCALYVLTYGWQAFQLAPNQWDQPEVVISPTLSIQNSTVSFGSLNVILALCKQSYTLNENVEIERVFEIALSFYASQLTYLLNASQFDSRQKETLANELGGEMIMAILSFQEEVQDPKVRVFLDKFRTAMEEQLKEFTPMFQ